MTIREKTQNLPPLEKITFLVGEIDHLRTQLDQQIMQEKSLDDLVYLLFLDELCEKFGISLETMRKKLVALGGRVFKLGKKFAIRKIHFLEVLEKLESV